jgi:hypothetical protein
MDLNLKENMMVVYEYFCEDCKIIWEKMYKSPPENPSEPIPCDECGKECKRSYISPPNVKTSMPWEGTGRSDSDYIDSYRRELSDLRIEETKKQANVHTKTGISPYSNITFNKEGLEAAGRIKPLSEEKRKLKEKKY